MLIAKIESLWCLAVRANPASQGVAIRVGRQMPRPGEPAIFKPLGPTGKQFSAQLPSADGMVFFANPRYHGMTVSPICWSDQNDDPILELHVSPGFHEPVQSILEESYFRFLAQELNEPSLGRLLIADGWRFVEMGLYRGSIHVDELDLEHVEAPLGMF